MAGISEELKSALHRYTHTIYPSRGEFEQALGSRKLTIYLGADPTGPHIHLGHATNLLFLKALQKAGHRIIFLIGDFTARIGDPTDKLSARQPLTSAEIKKNLTSFKSQASKIISFKGKNPATLKFNAKWLSKMNFAGLIELAQRVTVQQMIERDMFQERIKAGKPIGLHEFLYPLMQGYDSVAMDVDGEIGGDDQTFNMLMGRTLMRHLKNKEKFVVTTPLLVNPDTGKKIMNKSEGGLVNLDDEPNDMFGKIMAISDDVMFLIAKFSSEMPIGEIEILEREVKQSAMNPKDAKSKIAYAVVEMVHGAKAAQGASDAFSKVFSKKDFSGDLPQLTLKKTILAADAIVVSKVVKSKSEAWRLIQQGGFRVNDREVKNPKEELVLSGGEILKVGKRHFFRVSLK